MKYVAFRVDASSQIGTGHFMRCLTLAGALKLRGAQIRFISRYLPEHLAGMVFAEGHQLMALDSGFSSELTSDTPTYAHWLGTSQLKDAQAAFVALSDRDWDWLVVDHYALDARWESALRGAAKRILVIDDIANRRHDCDVLLDQNLFSDMRTRYVEKVPAHCQQLLGPHYALLRDEFRQLRAQVKPRTGPVKRVLVFFGGVDADNYTSLAITALTESAVRGIHVDVVIGAQHPNRVQIESECAEHQFDCHVQTNRMAELMAAADLAIGAGGSATWERCCLGLPALTVSLADNQTAIAQALDLLGAGRYVGSQETASVAVMRKAILDLLQDSKQVQSLSQKAYSTVDGLGVARLCEAMSC